MQAVQVQASASADPPSALCCLNQVLGCEPALLEQNVETLRTRWFLKGRMLANTVARKPQARLPFLPLR